MPHSKKEGKIERKFALHEQIPEICEMRNCNNCIFLEMRKRQDAYLWVSKMPHGPCARFLLQNSQLTNPARPLISPRLPLPI